MRFRRAFVSILTCQLNYFSHKRKGNNLYIFVASNNNHQLAPVDQPPPLPPLQAQQQQQQKQSYFFPSRRFPSKRNSFG